MCNVLHAYQFPLKYRPGKENQLADAMSRLPLPVTAVDHDKCRLIEPGHVEVFFVGASGVTPKRSLRPLLVEQVNSISSFVDEHQFAFCCQPLTSDDVKEQVWSTRRREIFNLPVEYNKNVGVIGPHTISECSSNYSVPCVAVVGQLESGVVMDACPIGLSTPAGSNERVDAEKCRLAPINKPNPEQSNAAVEYPLAESAAQQGVGESKSVCVDRSDAAHRLGEKLRQRSDVECAAAQREDPLASAAMTYVETESEDSAPAFVLFYFEASQFDINHVRKSAKQGTFMKLADGISLFVKRSTKPPPQPPARVSGKFERLLGDETTRVYVPFLLRPAILGSVNKEGFHLGENVTLASVEQYYWWIGMSASVKSWIRHCLVCQATKTTRRAPRWPLISLPLPSSPGEKVSFDILGPLPNTKNGNKYILLMVYLFSRHPEPYALTAEEKTTKGCASILANDYVTRWGCLKLLLSDRGSEFTALAQQVYEMLGSKKRLTRSFHPQTNGCVEIEPYCMPDAYRML